MPFDPCCGASRFRAWAPAVSALLLACTGNVVDGGTMRGSQGSGAVNATGSGAAQGSGAANGSGGAVSSGGSGASAGNVGSAGSASAGNGAATGAGTGGNAGAMTSACSGVTADPGPSPLSLMTRAQYLNVLGDLFESLPDLAPAFTSVARVTSIGAGQGDVSQVELEDFQRAAELLAAHAVEGERLATLLPCAEDAEARTCAREFVLAFGARAYRAPLTDEADIERHLTLYDAGATTDHRHGIELLLRGMLQSSRFLYRVELGGELPDGEAAVALSPHELAARLSFAFWNTLPDTELMAAAETGALATPEGLDSELGRLLSDPRGAPAMRRFLSDLIQLQSTETLVKDAALYPEFANGGFRAALVRQAEHFFDAVLGEQGGGLPTLLTSTTVFVNRDLAAYYGTSAGDDFTPFVAPSDRTAGLLTLPALLALTSKPDQSSPIYRGKFVREMLLCQSPPAPPPDIPPAPEVDPDVSTRERLRQHEVDPACSGCHMLLDPVGFGFEHFDAIGRYRETDGGEPVDARGEIFETGEIDGAFDGVRELAERLADSEMVRDCVARQWFRFVLGRFEQSADACSVERLTSAFRDSGADLNSLPAAVVRTDAFRYRRPIDAGTTP